MITENIKDRQNLDCNCNDCKWMIRDLEKFKKWSKWNENLQLAEFEKKKAEAYMIAELCPDEKGKQTLLNLANKMRFMFDKSILLSYGDCSKLFKKVYFIPNICQLETQLCFENRN